MKCHDIKNKLELYLDNELSVQEKAEIETHLLNCSYCTKEFANLKSLNSLGKTEILPQPSPSYWKESRQNIMNVIKATDKESIHMPALLQKLKHYFFPPKIGFRLAGLAATAVIIFFIIHISFIRQGKFELPQPVEIHDSISPPQPKAQLNQTKHEEKLDAIVPKKVPEAISFEDKVSDQLSTIRNEPQTIVNIPDHEIRTLPARSKLLEQESSSEAGEMDRKKGISDEAVPFRREAERAMAKPAYMSFEKKESLEKDASHTQSGGVSKSSTLADTTSLFKFELARRKALAVSEMTEKINIWEDYVQTQPALDLLRKAKYEQSRLYFDLAQTKLTEDQVSQAICFYEKNFEYLTAVADTTTIKKELHVLRQLLQKK